MAQSVRRVLRCPCAGKLAEDTQGLRCVDCGEMYRYDGGQIDLRLRRPKGYPLTFTVGEDPLSNDELPFAPLVPSPAPQVDFSGIKVPTHLTPTLLSHFPKGHPGALALDLGCGTGNHRAVIERAGFEWLGLDYFDPAAPVLGDAHSLPLESESVDFIMTIAVLEHLRYPFVAISEAYRVLKPGGRMIGTVAFLEPFHMDSHYHHTHLGTLNTLRFAGFAVETVAPDASWRVLQAQAHMVLFPKLPPKVGRVLVAPLDLIHRGWWRLAAIVSPRASRTLRVRHTTGAFTFIASKPVTTSAA